MSRLAQSVPPPPVESLPSTRRLLVWSAIAAIVVFLVAVTIVLPAERAIDPTGIGRIIGLTQMGEIKLALAMEAADHEAEDQDSRIADSLALIAATSDTAGSGTTHETRIRIAPRDSAEVRLLMKRGAVVTFSWRADSGAVSVVTVGDSLNARSSALHRYRPDVDQRMGAGELVAAFDGYHGWRWHNPATAPVTVTIRTTGRYLGGRQINYGE